MRRGVEEIGFADHDRYADLFDFPALSQAQVAYPGIKVRRGIEVDSVPGRQGEVRALLGTLDLDYAIGSVHSIGGWGIDDPRQVKTWEERDVDEVYGEYYALLARAASTRLFQVIGHLDLPKVFGYRPKGDASRYAEPAIRAIRQAGCAIEVNTNGNYRPAGEMYPSREVLDACFAAGIPVTLGSDAHVPENAGRDIALARDLAKQVGYTRLATFTGGKRVMQAI